MSFDIQHIAMMPAQQVGPSSPSFAVLGCYGRTELLLSFNERFFLFENDLLVSICVRFRERDVGFKCDDLLGGDEGLFEVRGRDGVVFVLLHSMLLFF